MALLMQKLEMFLKRCQKKQICLNKDKFRLKLRPVAYMGHLLTDEGIKPDPKKITAIHQMPKPTDVAGVRRMLGMVTYLAKFLPQLATMSEPLRQLTKQDVEWIWTYEHDKAMDSIKKAITQVPVLKYFNDKERATLQCDSSRLGIGVALMQGGQPVAYASRALTSTEQQYAQIEKELLSILFGLERFDKYTFGRQVRIQTDHKPLEALHKKPLHSVPKRLQRMFLRMQRYDVTVVYRKSKHMFLADTLSRAYVADEGSDACLDGEVLHLDDEDATEYLPMTRTRIEMLQQGTQTDETLMQLKNMIQNGWPEHKNNVSQSIRQYYDIRDELLYQNGIIFIGDRVIVPRSLRALMLDSGHYAHIGMNGCLRRAKECIYWPGMDAEIREYVSRCSTCRSFDAKQPRESLISHTFPLRPWAKVGTDIFHFEDYEHPMTVDYYSSFVEVDRLENGTSKEVIKCLKRQFSRYGIPDIVVSDNGPQYSSQEFAEFSRNLSFQHTVTSPYYSQSNGKVEGSIKTVKRMMKKAAATGSDPWLCLLDYRNTPTESLQSSPV